MQRAIRYAEEAFESHPMWARNPPNMARQFREGVICSNPPLIAYQATELLRMEARQREERGVAAPMLENAKKLTGLMAWDAESLSVRTLVTLLMTATNPDGSPQFAYLGQLDVKDRRIPEKPFVHERKQLPPLSPTDPRSVEYQQRHKAAKL